VQFRSRIIAAGLIAAVALVFTPASTALAADSTCYEFGGAERAFARKSNRARARRNVARLKLDPELSRVARRQTRRMIAKNLLHHTPSSFLSRSVTNWVTLGENVGVGGSVSSLQRAFMNSSGHRHNILNSSYRYVGIDARRRNGRLWVTVIFEGRRNPGTRLNMPSCR
jgi:uncharacterized protein YkwD